ncbi:MAG: RNA polymerase sigma factor [Actinomycetota bacterium]|nr:RNA polymerase sigma factor [Actinomycetota bacterium]
MKSREDELSTWVAEGYAPAFRTAFLILHDRHDAEEAVQDAFLRAWRFRAAVPPGAGVKPWLYRVVVNACYSKLRSDRHRRALFPGDETDVGRGPEGLALASEEHRAVLAALDRMPDHLRVVVALRYYAQLSEKEIATVIHRRPGTVKSRLHEARARLGSDPALTALVGTDREEAATP